jgi:uncharacterized protein HemX
MYVVKEPFWQFVDHWQTLIAALVAGALALLAVGLAVWSTLKAARRQVNATIDAANREIKAATDSADRQIVAAQEQARTAQHQTEVMLDMERRRIARKGYAFHVNA